MGQFIAHVGPQRIFAIPEGILNHRGSNTVALAVTSDGAPGDALEVEVLSLKHKGWGWNAVIPGFGLLADSFKEAALHIWTYDPTKLTPAM